MKILHSGDGHYHLGGEHDHGHAEGGCGHDHGHSHAHTDAKNKIKDSSMKEPLVSVNHDHDHEHNHDHDHDHDHHDHDHHDHDRDDHTHTFETWTIERSSPLTREDLERFAPGLGEDIYRAKGFVYLQEDQERRYIYQQVGKRWTLKPSTTWDREQPQTRLVVIGRRGATNLEALEALLGGSHRTT